MYPVTHGFYSQYSPNVYDTPHFANDIATPFHTPLTAFKAGKIVQEDYAPWGGEVYVKPDDGSTEYYFVHLDDVNVATGQHVNTGDVLGLSGGQTSGGDHPASAQWSTGPHTHVGYIVGYENTPVGSRPYGPDISGTIQALKAGGPSQVPLTYTQNQNQNQQQANQQQTNGYKVGLFIIALLFLGAGFYLVFQKQIHEAVKKGQGVAEQAAILAA
jgi:murein DD-endopeptidase MepM/ murein hydrolase activator NlpD